MEQNKSKLSSTKCGQMHIGKECMNCPYLKVHEEEMKTTEQEKYLGDIITDNGKQDATIDNRVAKAWSYVSEIRAILNEFQFGKIRTEVGIILREAIFINRILYNSEALQGLTGGHIMKLSIVDH